MVHWLFGKLLNTRYPVMKERHFLYYWGDRLVYDWNNQMSSWTVMCSKSLPLEDGEMVWVEPLADWAFPITGNNYVVDWVNCSSGSGSEHVRLWFRAGWEQPERPPTTRCPDPKN